MKDTGNYEVTEVPQLYVRDKVGSVTRPVKGSKRILKLGEKRTVSFELSMRELAFWNIKMKKANAVEFGELLLWVLTDSQCGSPYSFSVAENTNKLKSDLILV